MSKSSNSFSEEGDAKPHKLGEVFCAFPFQQTEQERIAGLAINDGPIKQLLSVYAPKTEPYREFERKERIAGFRPGTEAFKQKLSLRLVEHLTHPKSPGHNYCWQIYRVAAIKYVNTELPALNKLLAETECPSNPEDANSLFSAICANAFDYEVKATDVKVLYEIWWTDRVDKLDDILSLCSNVNEQQAQARMMARVSAKLDEIRASIETLGNDASSNKATQVRHQEESEKQRAYVQKLQSELQSAASKTNESVSSLKHECNERFQEIESNLAILRQDIAKFEPTIASKVSTKTFESNLKNFSEDNKILLDTLHETFNSLIERTATNFTAKLDELEQRLAALCSDLVNQSDTTARASSGKAVYKSPLAYAMTGAPPQAKVTKEADFINSWGTVLSRNKQLILSNEQLFAYHCLFLSNTVIISDIRLVETWLDALGWRSYTKQVVASPLWAREEDWSEGVLHLFGDLGNSRNPKCLIIHNYDAGIIDCYLLPTLMLWSLRGPNPGLPAKIFLVTAGGGAAPAHNLMEYATYLQSFNSDTNPPFKFSGSQPILSSIRGEVPIGVDPKNALLWLQASTRIAYEFSAIQKHFELQFTDQLTTNFQRTVACAHRFFDEPSAVGIGMHHHIMPWIKSKYPEKYDAVLAYVSELPGIVC